MDSKRARGVRAKLVLQRISHIGDVKKLTKGERSRRRRFRMQDLPRCLTWSCIDDVFRCAQTNLVWVCWYTTSFPDLHFSNNLSSRRIHKDLFTRDVKPFSCFESVVEKSKKWSRNRRRRQKALGAGLPDDRLPVTDGFAINIHLLMQMLSAKRGRFNPKSDRRRTIYCRDGGKDFAAFVAKVRRRCETSDRSQVERAGEDLRRRSRQLVGRLSRSKHLEWSTRVLENHSHVCRKSFWIRFRVMNW